jgi:hypothetical protein
MTSLYERLQQNDPTLIDLDWPYKSSCCLIKLGRSLAGNTFLKKLTFRRLDLTYEAAQALATGICQSKIDELQLEDGLIREQSPKKGSTLRILHEGITTSETIQKLLIDNSHHSRDLEVILSGLSNLRELKLVNPSFSYKTARGFASRIGSWQLQKLEITNPIPKRRLGREQLWQILGDGVQSSQTIQKLAIGRVGSGFEESEGLFAGWENIFARLSVLSFFRCNFPVAGLTQLTQALQNNVSLTSLAMQSCYFPVNQLLSQLTSALSISRSSLQTLDLSGSYRIGYEGLRRICESIQVLPHLTNVLLSDCAHLRYYGREISPEDALRRAEELAMQTQAAQAFAQAVQQNPSLHNMDVSENDFTEKQVMEIAFHTTINRIRPYLMSADHNGLNNTIWCYIFAKQNRQSKGFISSLIFYALSEQPNLIQPCHRRPTRKRSRHET